MTKQNALSGRLRANFGNYTETQGAAPAAGT